MSKTQPKTRPTSASVSDYIAAIADDDRRADCRALIALMRDAVKESPKMWGTSIVGFSSYHYIYESGHEGDAPSVGFSSRKPDMSVYLAAGGPGQKRLLTRLGKYKMGKSCLSIRRLSDIDVDVLRELILDAHLETKRRYG